MMFSIEFRQIVCIVRLGDILVSISPSYFTKFHNILRCETNEATKYITRKLSSTKDYA